MQFPPPAAPPEDPLEQAPIAGVGAVIESILRQPKRVRHALRQPGAGRVIIAMVWVAVICALIYGVVVGTFSRGPQLWIAPLKIAAIICLPSLYIFACLSGSRARLSEMAGLVAGLLLLTSFLLFGFAPVAWLFSQSTHSPGWMGALHLSFWAVATLFGLRFLGAGFAGTQAKSQAGLCVWAVIFVLVCLQLTTALRPIIGTAHTVFPGAAEKKFFVKHWIDNLNDGQSRPPENRLHDH